MCSHTKYLILIKKKAFFEENSLVYLAGEPKVATFALSKENNPAGFDKKIRFLVQNRFKVNRLFLYRFLVFGY